MTDAFIPPPRQPSLVRNALRIVMIGLGCVVILLPAWLPNHPDHPIQTGTVEILQSLLLAASTAVVLGASPHAGAYRPVCRIMALGLSAAFLGEIEDFLSQFLKMKFPIGWCIGAVIMVALVIAMKHKRVVSHYLTTLGQHAGSGFIGSALLILYAFNRLMGKQAFWKATLGADFSPAVAKTCSGYLELLACYLIFIGTLGLSITLARRREPS